MRLPLYALATFLVSSIPLFNAHASASQPFTISGTTLTTQNAVNVVNTLYPSQFNSTQQQQLGAALQSQYNQQIGQFDTNFENQVNGYLTQTNFGPITEAFADAGVAAAKSMPVDYASDFSLFTLTSGFGASVHGINLNNLQNLSNPTVTNHQSPDQGAGVNVSLLLGINLGFFHIPAIGFFDPSKLSVYVNFFNYTTPTISNTFTASTTSFGLHGQYRVLDSISVLPFGLLRWGGINVGTGLTYSDLSLHGSGTFDTSNSESTFQYTAAGYSDTVQLAYSYGGKADVGVDIRTFAIPFEASTSVQLLHALTLYVGGGFDLNFGSASGTATSTDVATLTLKSANTGNTAANFVTPTATLNFNSPSFSPSIGDLRGFGGVQLNIVVVGIFAQASADTASNYAVNGGIRAYW